MKHVPKKKAHWYRICFHFDIFKTFHIYIHLPLFKNSIWNPRLSHDHIAQTKFGIYVVHLAITGNPTKTPVPSEAAHQAEFWHASGIQLSQEDNLCTIVASFCGEGFAVLFFWWTFFFPSKTFKSQSTWIYMAILGKTCMSGLDIPKIHNSAS